MRVGDYVIRPDTFGWILTTIREGRDREGNVREYEKEKEYPGTFPVAVKALQERMVRDGHPLEGEVADLRDHVQSCYDRVTEAVTLEEQKIREGAGA